MGPGDSKLLSGPTTRIEGKGRCDSVLACLAKGNFLLEEKGLKKRKVERQEQNQCHHDCQLLIVTRGFYDWHSALLSSETCKLNLN